MSLERLRTHGKEKKEHNFLSPPCQLRQFDRMEQHLKDQIGDFEDIENFAEVSDFVEFVNAEENHNIERQFREKGKYHNSIIGNNNSPIDSMHFALGGDLHNVIGLGNDCLKNLFNDLKSENLENICDDIKHFLDSPHASGGAGCTPGQHHGGQYNGEF